MISNPRWAGFSLEMDDLLFAVLGIVMFSSRRENLNHAL
jgi:hypothetical protein